MLRNRYAIAASVIFDGAEVHRDRAVFMRGGRILDILHVGNLPHGVPVRTLPEGAWLAPGFIDAQVNGGGDVLLNDDPGAGAMAAIAAAHRKFGTTGIMPTLITDAREKMVVALEAVDRAAALNAGVLGLHLEGPFISPEKPGIHSRDYIREPTAEDLDLLTAPRETATLVTLAPERVGAGVVERLADAGVRVSLGHSMATYEETKAALDEGLTGFTHLFNAMRPLGARDPGPIAAALEAPNAFFGMIVDGEHVAPPMLRLALRGAAHPMLVTDAMPPVGGKTTSFLLNGQDIVLKDGRLTNAAGTLAGSALDMASAVRNTVEMLGVPLTDALRFASTEPAAFLGFGDLLGRISPDFRADLVAFDPRDMRIYETWVDGRPSESTNPA
ncbi:N-acetylglucosamine 6-phosphate deacetylase [Rhodomicrobium udaipurense JA643]|uniref:N-acetylglucosamine-6-phosphate deacetylase n=1 Tax=Rhodomicrobium udaipurense TaxID=1202716 RepID=A0A8I1KIU2_9HYPH|nr:N-acetylglucosamine-6-phosphate deacetylase [Rhodomicrobium udaipurense]KAI94573.1 N-acetylglucosamine 6-phosphate deacetylase [Rhodomicrobium udaipurense JA643]MBJ7545065.1 N-acetylglucosamine-6-phosphate deacetylase [Rhodomicrobium udaipurense]